MSATEGLKVDTPERLTIKGIEGAGGNDCFL
jgi:hypothetical protein